MHTSTSKSEAIDKRNKTTPKDGRRSRRTGRTVQFATRVTPEWNNRFRKIADEEDVLLAELLERMLEAYKPQNDK